MTRVLASGHSSLSADPSLVARLKGPQGLLQLQRLNAVAILARPPSAASYATPQFRPRVDIGTGERQSAFRSMFVERDRRVCRIGASHADGAIVALQRDHALEEGQAKQGRLSARSGKLHLALPRLDARRDQIAHISFENCI